MILYFAGNVISVENETLLNTFGLRHRLLSFAEIDGWSKKAFAYWEAKADPAEGMFLDSGAFGALTQKTVIDLPRYCSYIHEHAGAIRAYAALDVIGDWEGSARNYEYMRGQGLEPIPTFHMGSPEPELRRLCQAAGYIALGGVVGAMRPDMQPWLDKCWRTIKDYWPIRVHLFGVTAQWALERYPLYSADSSSALVGAGMGRVMSFKEGKVISQGWAEYGQERMDGDVMDNVSHLCVQGGSAWKGRSRLNIGCMLALQRHVTDTWTARGITWADQDAILVG